MHFSVLFFDVFVNLKGDFISVAEENVLTGPWELYHIFFIIL
jgi:hypothetical protein